MVQSGERRALLRVGFAFCASLAVGPARACEYITGALRITHPWTRATGPATTAAICMLFDEVHTDERLIGVETPVAQSAELIVSETARAVDLHIPKGRETLLSEESTYI